MSNHNDLLESIARKIADYRLGELTQANPEHVDRWIGQFESNIHVPLMKEVDYMLGQTYLSKDWFIKYYNNVIKNKSLTGNDPISFWKRVNFLDIQSIGHSQHELSILLGRCLQREYNIDINACRSPDGPYLYLDDVIFSGTRVGSNLEEWILANAPKSCEIIVLVAAAYKFGAWKVEQRINDAATSASKAINFKVRLNCVLENRKSHKDISEVLWPVGIANNELLDIYTQEEEKYPFIPRRPGRTVEGGLFSSEDGRQLLEREFLNAGLKIRSFCRSPSPIMRPLGYGYFGLGFGSTIITYRNCPNNAPLALWWGDTTYPQTHPFSKWHPLTQRKTNAEDG